MQLNRLILALNDNHSRVYGLIKGADEAVRSDSVEFEKLKNSNLFTIYPRPNIDLDSLKIILKDYLKNNNVYVLINNRSMSNAEQFAYKLSTFNNCTTLGNRTYGAAAYELVDASYNLPCGDFMAVLTSKKHSKFLKLESAGLGPDVKFGLETEWILQLQNYIEKRN